MKFLSTRTLPLALLALVLCGFAPLDDEIVKEFKKYFKKFKETPDRVEAVLALEGEQAPAVVRALLPVLKDKEPEVVEAAVTVLSKFEERPPIDALLEALESKKDESIRIGILRAMGDGGYSGTKDGLLACLPDRSWDVRRRAVQALAKGGYKDTCEAIVPLAKDKEVAVRCASLDALGALASELAIDPGIAALKDDSWQVRSSAIGALGKVRHKRSIGPLIEAMEVEQGRLITEFGDALGSITGRSFGTRTEQWRRFWDQFKDRYEIPTDEELAKLREKQKKIKESYKPPGTVNFIGVDTPSRSIAFVIDTSGSMEDEVVEKERFEDGEYPSFRRIDIVKTELKRTIENLESYVEFNIYSFATEVKQWKKKQVKANVLNKKSALEWVSRLDAIGGSSKEDLARNGLTGSANLGAGKTNTFDALMTALGAAGRGVKDKHYKVAVDTIFFLSDGRPSEGKFTVPEDILREVRKANELRKVVIHTIAIGQFQKTFMQTLAEANGGIFVDLGK